MADQSMHVVTGAFGYSGKYIAQRLLAQGRRVMTLTNSVQRQVNDHVRARRSLEDLLNATRNDFILNAIGRDIDDAWTAMAISRTYHLRQVLA